MDKKTKIFFAVFFLLIAGSVGFTYYRIMIKKDYVIENQIDCDPTAEKCFIWECDPESTVEGEACTDDPEMNIWYYKIVHRNAGMIPLCDPSTDETCDPWTCQTDEKDCGETLCDEINKVELGAECSDPEEYAANNPSEESACEEGDEACLAAKEDVVDEALECAEGEACPVPLEEEKKDAEVSDESSVEEALVWYEIPELNIKFQVTPDSKIDLKYSTATDNEYQVITASFYYQSLRDYLKNSADVDAAAADGESAFAISKISESQNASSSWCSEESIVLKSGGYIFCSSSSQSTIVTAPQYEKYQESVKDKNFGKYIDTLQLIEEAQN